MSCNWSNRCTLKSHLRWHPFFFREMNLFKIYMVIQPFDVFRTHTTSRQYGYSLSGSLNYLFKIFSPLRCSVIQSRSQYSFASTGDNIFKGLFPVPAPVKCPVKDNLHLSRNLHNLSESLFINITISVKK